MTFNVSYRFYGQPTIRNVNANDDCISSLTDPDTFYTVFDKTTQRTLENDNDQGVVVKGGKWKTTYYPKQYFKILGKKDWFRFAKTQKYSFTVTYPKDYKDAVVGIGFSTLEDYLYNRLSNDADYWKGQLDYSETALYKKGENTMSYMHLE